MFYLKTGELVTIKKNVCMRPMLGVGIELITMERKARLFLFSGDRTEVFWALWFCKFFFHRPSHYFIFYHKNEVHITHIQSYPSDIIWSTSRLLKWHITKHSKFESSKYITHIYNTVITFHFQKIFIIRTCCETNIHLSVKKGRYSYLKDI